MDQLPLRIRLIDALKEDRFTPPIIGAVMAIALLLGASLESVLTMVLPACVAIWIGVKIVETKVSYLTLSTQGLAFRSRWREPVGKDWVEAIKVQDVRTFNYQCHEIIDPISGERAIVPKVVFTYPEVASFVLMNAPASHAVRRLVENQPERGVSVTPSEPGSQLRLDPATLALGIPNPSNGAVLSVSASPTHSLSKPRLQRITLVAGLGVEGDAHSGETVKHRSRVAVDPTQPNLRQVHLIHSELHAELEEQGFSVEPGQMGENITTAALDLLRLPVGTNLRIGQDAVVEVTGLRNPCAQLDQIQSGLTKATLGRDSDGNLIRKAGIMGIVLVGGIVEAGDYIVVELPPAPHQALQVV